MTEPLPITTPPRRRHEPQMMVAAASAATATDSCKTTPLTRRLEPFHHALLDSGCQSAKSSPLPHRRLDKLEGTIRDNKSSPMSARRRLDDDPCSSTDSSPAPFRKFNVGCACSHQDSPMLGRRPPPHHLLHHQLQEQQQPQSPLRRFTDCATGGVAASSSPLMRRRVESDCAVQHRRHVDESGCSTCSTPLTMSRKTSNVYSSPAKSVLGEPGCFSSPVHQRNDFGQFGSPAKSVLGEPGVFASPARSLCISPCDETAEAEVPMQPDLTVVSGWLKFRDNKRVSLELSIFFLETFLN